jgi:hypothetical protein
MTTASNAKINVSAPSVGYTPVVTAFSVPASAAAAIAIPVADANSGLTRIPCSRATAGSSEVARTRRPHAVKRSSVLSPPITASASISLSIASQGSTRPPT